MSCIHRRSEFSALLLTVVVVFFPMAMLLAQPGTNDPFSAPAPAEPRVVHSLDRHALIALPLATGLGALLAVRPTKRRGLDTPKRSLPVIQTQIILAIIGSVVML